jgi:NAD(P)-dependent dehydrogenase (short-subunit alcohol dehydrogenase family)
MRLQGKRALVTGAGPNIGQAICRALAEEGAVVACNGIDGERASAVVRQIEREGGRALAVQADVTDVAQVRAMIDLVADRLGGLDILVNNAAMNVRKGLLEVSVDEWRDTIDVILTGTFLCSRYAAALMVQQGTGGAIVNVASTSGHRGKANALAYCTAKGGILNMTRAMALDLAAHRIRANSISPTRTGTSVDRSKPADSRAPDGIPLGRIGTPRDQARAVVYLVSDDAEFVTGCDLRVDGGALACAPLHDFTP